MLNLIKALIISGWISLRVPLRSQERGWKRPPGTPRLPCLGDFPPSLRCLPGKRMLRGFGGGTGLLPQAPTLWELGVRSPTAIHTGADPSMAPVRNGGQRCSAGWLRVGGRWGRGRGLGPSRTSCGHVPSLQGGFSWEGITVAGTREGFHLPFNHGKMI